MKSFEENLKELFHYAFITNCYLDDYSVTQPELDSIETFSGLELLENFKDLILDLLNFKKQNKDQNHRDVSALKYENDIKNHIKVLNDMRNLLDGSVNREERLIKSHHLALEKIKELEKVIERLEKEKGENYQCVKQELSNKISELNAKIDLREHFASKLEYENARLKRLLEEKFIEIEIVKKNMKKNLEARKEGPKYASVDISKRILEEKTLEVVQNQQKIKEKIGNPQIMRDRNRENRKSYNFQEFNNLIAQSSDSKLFKSHKRSNSDSKY